MFEDDSLKIKLYLWTVIFFGLGSLAGIYLHVWLGLALYLLGGVVSLHIIIVSIVRERRSFVEAETDRANATRELYETVQKMDAEARYAFGLTFAKPEVMVKIDQTAKVGNEFSQIWRKLPIAPYKLKIIAQAAINGEAFTNRKWAGDGKLLTDDEWRALQKSMVDLGLREPNGDDPRQGFSWTSLGEDVMTQVVRDTL